MNKYYLIYFFLIIRHGDSYSFYFSLLCVPIVYTGYSFLNYFLGDNGYKKEYINIPLSFKEKYLSSVDFYFGVDFFDKNKIINFYENYIFLKKATVIPFLGSMAVAYGVSQTNKNGSVYSDVPMGLLIQILTTFLTEGVLCKMSNFSVEKNVEEFKCNSSIKSKLVLSPFFKKYIMTYIRALHSEEMLDKNKDLYVMKEVYFNFFDMEKMIDTNSQEVNNYTSILYRYMNTIYDKYLNSKVIDKNLSNVVFSVKSFSYKISKISLLCKNINTVLKDNEKYIDYDEKFLFSIYPINIFLSNDDFLLGLSIANQYADSVISALSQKEVELSSFLKQEEFKNYKKVVDLYNNYKQLLFKKNFIIDNCFEKKNILIAWFNSPDIIQVKQRNIEEYIKTIESVKSLLDIISTIEQDIKKNEKMYYSLTSNWYFNSISYEPVDFANVYSSSFEDMNCYINLLECKNNKIVDLIKSINLTKEKFNFVYATGEKLREMFHDVSNLSSFVEFANKENFKESFKNFNHKNDKYQADSDFVILTKSDDLKKEYANQDEIFFKRWMEVLRDFKVVENVYVAKKKVLHEFKHYIMQYRKNIFFNIIFNNYTVPENNKNYIDYFSFLNKEIFGDIDTFLFKEKKDSLLEEEKKQTLHLEHNIKECKKIDELVLFEDTCLLNNPLHFSESQLNYIITKYQNLLHQNNFYIKDNLELILQKDISLKEYLQKIDIPNFRDHIQVLSEYHKEFLFFDEWYHGFIKKNANKMKLFESHVYESDELYYKKIELDCQNYYAQVSSYNLDNFFSLMTKKNQAIKEAIIEIKNKKNDFIKKEKIIFRQSIIYRKQFLQNLFHDTEKLFSDEKKAQYREKIDKINALFNIYNEKLADNEDKISEVDGEINNLIQELRAASFI